MYVFLVKIIILSQSIYIYIYIYIYILIFTDGKIVDGRCVDLWTRSRGQGLVEKIFNLTRGFVEEVSWTRFCGLSFGIL